MAGIFTANLTAHGEDHDVITDPLFDALQRTQHVPEHMMLDLDVVGFDDVPDVLERMAVDQWDAMQEDALTPTRKDRRIASMAALG